MLCGAEFDTAYELHKWVNKEKIRKEDVQAIMYDTGSEMYVLFWWG